MSEVDVPSHGDHVIVQRQSYMKIHKLSPSGSVKLGKSVVLMDNVVGKPYWTTYRMEPKKDKKGVFNLVECSSEESDCQMLIRDVTSGVDNRNILDDGSGQKLSRDEIIGMREEGLSSKEIVGTLIENSTTFQEKTEYSQEKYLKKKEKKYCEYITVRKPTLRLVADIMYKQVPNDIMGLRSDTLSQLSTAVNLHPHGKYIMYESGCQSLASAAVLNNLSSEGRLILVHPGSNPQKQAIQSMNLANEHEKLIYVNIYTLLRRLLHYSPRTDGQELLVKEAEKTKGSFDDNTKPVLDEEMTEGDTKTKCVDSTIDEEITKGDTETKCEDSTIDEEITKGDTETKCEDSTIDEEIIKNSETKCGDSADLLREPINGTQTESRKKRKHSGEEEVVAANKKPRFLVEADRAVSLLTEAKADGLIIVSREHPANILKAFLPYVGASRNFVVYGSMREPLQELSMEIRKRSDVIYVQLSEMWLRNYQVMENRTHPFVAMSGGGGYLLTGVVVE